jgi:hypothetical protein
MLEELAREVLHAVVLAGADHVVVEAVEALLPQLPVIDVIGIDLVERRAPRLEQILGGVGRRRYQHVHVAALDEPEQERGESGAGHRAGQAHGDEAALVDHPRPRLERLAELAPLKGRVPHPVEETADRSSARAVSTCMRFLTGHVSGLIIESPPD